MASFLDYVVVTNAGLFGWILIDLLSNALLKKDKQAKQVKIRILGARWVKRSKAVKVAIAQFIIAFVVSFFIQNLFSYMIEVGLQYLAPISIISIGLAYLYLLLGLPYDVTWKRSVPTLVCFSVGALLIAIIYYLI